jgi:hypothetical protein
MSSIRRVQTERLLQDVVRTLYSSGTQPMLSDVTGRIARHFSKYPAGRPMPLPLMDIVRGMRSNTKLYNRLLELVAVNIDVLYETSLRQVEDILMLTASLQTDIERLDHKRKRIETRIDDYLLSQYNTDGYFYSVSDNFSDIDLTDLIHTSAQVDTDSGCVVLPTLSSKTKALSHDLISPNPSIRVKADGVNTSFVELAPFTGAISDSLNNILWAF